MSDLPRHLQRPKLKTAEASEYLAIVHGVSVAPATLNKMRCCGGGPAFQKFGKFPLYQPADLDEWVAARMSAKQRSTSDAPGGTAAGTIAGSEA